VDVPRLVWFVAVEIKAIRTGSQNGGTGGFYRIALILAQAYTMAVTPTSTAYERDNSGQQGRCLGKLLGLRVRVETPGPPVFGKER
jgi:hypothetical protein